MADYLSGATLPSGAELYQSAAAKWAASQVPEPTATDETVTPPAATPPTDELYAPYRARKGITFDIHGGDTSYAATLDDIIGRKQEFGDYQVTVRDPQGQRRGVAVKDVDAALADGYKLEGSHETRAHEFVQEHKGLSGAARVASENFLDELFLGIPGVIEQHTADPQKLANLEALKHDHELANALGGVAGFAGSMVAGGPLFKGAAAVGKLATTGVVRAAERVLANRLVEAGVETGAKSLAKQLVAKSLGSAVGLGAEAAVIVAPKAVTEAALGDPDAAAETMLWSMGAGAALGVLAPAGKELFGRASKAIFATPASIPGKVEAYANEQALKSLNPLKRYSKALAGIEGGEQAAGKTIRELDLMPRAGEEGADLVNRIEETHNSIGEQISAKYAEADAKLGAHLNVDTIAADMREKMLTPLREKIGYRDIAAKVENYIDEFAQKAGTATGEATAAANDTAARMMTTGELWQVRRDLRRLIKGEVKAFSATSAGDELTAIQKHLDQTSYAELGKTMGKDFERDLGELGRKYRVVGVLEEAATDNIARKITNRTNSLTDYITGGGLAGAGATAGAFLAGPAGAALGAGAGKLVGMFGNKYLRENYNRLAVQGADKLGILFAEQAVRRAAKEIDRVPAVLERMGGGKTLAQDVADATPVRALTAIFGSEGSRGEMYQHAAERLDGALANMDATSQKVADISGAIAEGGAPTIAASYTARQHAALAYLQQTMPRAKSVLPSLFGPKGKFTPSEREMHAWERRAEIVENPFAAFRHLEKGTLTREHIEALDAVYPQLASQLRQRIALHAADPAAPVLSATARSQVALLLGDAPGGGKSMRRYQANYEADEQQEKAKGMAGAVSKASKVPTLETQVSRLSNR